MTLNDAIKEGLGLLAEAWPANASRLRGGVWCNAIFRLAKRMSASPEEVAAAAMRIVDTRQQLTSATNISWIFAEALQELRGGGGGNSTVYQCAENACNKGHLRLVLDDGHEVYIPCPYCETGERHRQLSVQWQARRREFMGDRYIDADEDRVTTALQAYVARRDSNA